MGAGLLVTENFSSLGSSQTSIGSTKGPVEKTQCRTAPTADGELKFVQEWPFENRFSFLGFSSRLQKGICSSGPGWIFFRS
jgi:hypothetical protein